MLRIVPIVAGQFQDLGGRQVPASHRLLEPAIARGWAQRWGQLRWGQGAPPGVGRSHDVWGQRAGGGLQSGRVGAAEFDRNFSEEVVVPGHSQVRHPL